MRWFTRLTNAFSKKLENHHHVLALYFVFYNFAKMHKAMKMTPAFAAGITDKLWNMEDIVALNRCGGTEAGTARAVQETGGSARNFKLKHYPRAPHLERLDHSMLSSRYLS